MWMAWYQGVLEPTFIAEAATSRILDDGGGP
jgi:hypothetical protein